MKLRSGQWVKFNVAAGFPEDVAAMIHRAADGRFVGLHIAAGRDATGEEHGAQIFPAKKDNGYNVMILHEDHAKTLFFPLTALSDLEPLVGIAGRDDIPIERLKGTPTGWVPEA